MSLISILALYLVHVLIVVKHRLCWLSYSDSETIGYLTFQQDNMMDYKGRCCFYPDHFPTH
jgi:hypothetical protein